MSPENVDLVRSIHSAWERGDYSSADWAHPEIEYVHADGPDSGSWRGLTSMAEAFRNFMSAWEDFRVEAEQYRELDAERVLVLFRFGARGKRSGLEAEQIRTRGAQLFHVCGGKVTRFVQYFDRENAFADLGLSEQENVKHVRAVFDAWNTGNMNALRELYDPAIVVRYAEDWPEGSEPTMGREAVIRQWEQQRAAFDTDTLEPIEFVDAGDRVVVRQRWSAEGRGPDLNIEVSTVNTFRKGKMILLEFFWDHAEALEAVGLSE